MPAQRDFKGRFVKGHTTNNGHPRSEETKQKISEATKGKSPTSGSFKKGCQSVFKGKKRPRDTGNRKPNQTSFKKGITPWNRGLTKETDERMKVNGENNSLTSRIQYLNGRKPWNRGLTKRTDSRVCDLAKTKSGVATVCGEKHGNWRGGISYKYNGEPYPSYFDEELKKQVRKRDELKCQNCGICQSKLKRSLDVHHIDGDKNNLSLNNLISYCRSCHIKKEWEIQRRV